jgi:hypothetical protein
MIEIDSALGANDLSWADARNQQLAYCHSERRVKVVPFLLFDKGIHAGKW